MATNVSSYKRVQSIIGKCLRRILRIWWPNCTNNQKLWQQTNQLPPLLQIHKQKWTWIGHTLRKDPRSITRQTIKWNLQGKRRRGRPRNTWRRSVEDEMSNAGHSWYILAHMTQNGVRWRGVVSGLCSAQTWKGISQVSQVFKNFSLTPWRVLSKPFHRNRVPMLVLQNGINSIYL